MRERKIAENLVKLRFAKGVTQEEVALSLSLSNKTISKWETGASIPDSLMLIKLAKYYNVSADLLLGLTDEKKVAAREVGCSVFEGLDRKETVFKAFELLKAMVPAMIENFNRCRGELGNRIDVFPTERWCDCRSGISTHELYDFIANSDEANVAVMLFRNKANFAWLNDPEKQIKTVRLFRFLSHEDVLSVLYFIHSPSCSDSFTAQYISHHTNVTEQRAAEILNEFCAVGACHWLTAHLAEGEVRVYECRGDGLLLSMLTLAYEGMCGKPIYDYCFRGPCKMTGGK